MSSTFSAESADSALDSKGPECEPLPSARETSASAQPLPSSGQASPASPMWKRYAAMSVENLTLFAGASHVRTYLTLDDVPGLQASARDYGLTSADSLATYDRDTRSWRTSQGSLFGGLTEFLATWPMSGTTRNGTAYRRRPLAPRTYERASGFLPTPVASEVKRTTPYSQGGQSLSYVLGGRPSQALLAWMMGFRDGWLARLAMPSCQKSRTGLVKRSSKRKHSDD
jgi:hypothetical protein